MLGVRARTGRVILSSLSGATIGQHFLLGQRESTLGRSQTANFHVPEHDVSRVHAKFLLDVDGIAKVVDLRSTNGILVNDAL